MSFTFRPAKREAVGLIIGLAAPSGGGKTWSAFELATGLSGDRRFCCIDTEAGRALHYADRFQFDHGDLKAPFSPARYLEAIQAADGAGYPCIVVDSFSHEHAGEGGILDMQEAEFQRMGARDAARMASWIKPKQEHRRMVNALLQVRAHLILSLRAEQKVDMVKNPATGKIEVQPKKILSGFSEWIPVAEKNLLFELTCSFLLSPDAPGVAKPIKLPEALRPYVPTDRPLTADVGQQLGKWARGAVQTIPPPAAGPADDERTLLIAQIRAEGTRRQLTERYKRDLLRQHGIKTIDTADVAALHGVLAAIQRVPK